MVILATLALQEWIPLLIQMLVTTGAIFGSAGFWQWKQNREQIKRDQQSKENGVENKVDTISESVSELNTKFDSMTSDMKHINEDIALLKEANKAAKQYIASRTIQDEEVLKAQNAIINSLTVLLRERLLEAYTRCSKKGYYTKAERETYGELFKCYENEPFNGDGVMHDLQPIIKGLPWTAEEAGVEDDEDCDT